MDIVKVEKKTEHLLLSYKNSKMLKYLFWRIHVGPSTRFVRKALRKTHSDFINVFVFILIEQRKFVHFSFTHWFMWIECYNFFKTKKFVLRIFEINYIWSFVLTCLYSSSGIFESVSIVIRTERTTYSDVLRGNEMLVLWLIEVVKVTLHDGLIECGENFWIYLIY